MDLASAFRRLFEACESKESQDNVPDNFEGDR